MGLFDFFSSAPAQNAAGAQNAGLLAGNQFYQGQNQQAQNALSSNLQSGIGALSNTYGQGQGALGTNYGAALGALQNTTGQGLNSFNSAITGGAIPSLQQNYAAGLAPSLQNYQTGQQGTTAYGNALGLNGPQGTQQALNTFWQSPQVQAQLDPNGPAMQNILRSFQASGGGQSGGELAALNDYARNAVAQSYGQYTNSLQPYLNFAQGAAGNVGNLYSNLGNQLASTYGALGQGNLGAQQQLGTNLANVSTGLGSALNSNFQNLGNQTAGIYGNLGTGLASLYNQSGQAGYGTDVGIGNANASAALAPYNASANELGFIGGLLGAGAKTAGSSTGPTGGLTLLGQGLGKLGMPGF